MKKNKNEVNVTVVTKWIDEENGSIVKTEKDQFVMKTAMEAVNYMGHLVAWGYQRIALNSYYDYDSGDYRDGIGIETTIHFEEA